MSCLCNEKKAGLYVGIRNTCGDGDVDVRKSNSSLFVMIVVKGCVFLTESTKALRRMARRI